MALVSSRPLTPGQRFLIRNKADVSKKRPEKKLTVKTHDKKGRNCYGRITSRRRGGGHKKHYRIIDFRRDKLIFQPPFKRSSTIQTVRPILPSCLCRWRKALHFSAKRS